MMLLPLAAMAQSSLYKSYASRQHLTVAQVSGFMLNESVRVDVVMVVASHERRTVAFYRINTEAQYDALLDYQLNNMKNTK